MKHHSRRKHFHTCRICSEIYNTSIFYVCFQSSCFDQMINQAWGIPRSWKHNQLNPRLQWLSFFQLTQKCDTHIPKWRCKANHKMNLEWVHVADITSSALYRFLQLHMYHLQIGCAPVMVSRVQKSLSSCTKTSSWSKQCISIQYDTENRILEKLHSTV